MNLSNHAKLRTRQRGISHKFIDYAEYFLPSIYKNQCYKIFMSKKQAKVEAKKIRKLADLIEKHGGIELLFDSTGSLLITTYRK